MIDIKKRRELFWDDYLIDTEKTSAKLTLHHLKREEKVMVFDKPWEGACGYFNIIRVKDTFRMYYGGGKIDAQGDITHMVICFIESKDGVKWTRPDIGLHEFDGSYNNNIILVRSERLEFDNFFVFIDENAACPPDEKFKGIGMRENSAKQYPADRELWCYTSADGIRFQRGWKMTDGGVRNGGIFDSLNTVYWDANKRKYISFVRGIHGGEHYKRDIRYMESADFKNWSEPIVLQYGEDADDFQLYTNVASRYYRAPHIYLAFPTRYVQRTAWTKNFDVLGGEEGAARRREIMQELPRAGTAMTDCIFMNSRDGINWSRFDEAFITPGIERRTNWSYGCCYPAYGLIETKSEFEFAPNDISMFYSEERRWTNVTKLYRHTMRQDGFASYRATYKPCEIYTKPFIFEGKELKINFATSAIGYLFITLLDAYGKPMEGFTSCELFGDSVDRTVFFQNGSNVSSLAGQPIRMHIKMSDADIYSFIFE